MGQKNITITYCDLCGYEHPTVTTTKLTWDHKKWSLDLCDYCRENTTERIYQIPGLDLLNREQKPKGPPYKAAEGVNLTEVRDWANKQNIEVSKRGRINATVIQAFKTAHNIEPETD
jgi:hypothetical protein